MAAASVPVMASSEHDFDPVFGQWTVHNRKMVDVTDPACDTWVEFDATSDVQPVLHGFGHVDRMTVSAPADGGPPFEGLTLRLFEPDEAIWRIWWSSTRFPGVLDTPLSGRFEDGHGVFESEDTVGGRPARVRFEWFLSDPDLPRWQQSFSYDDGETWSRNWIMHFTRR